MKRLLILAMMATLMVPTLSNAERRDETPIRPKHKVEHNLGKPQRVVATWYQCCARTANGERFNPDGMTAAHKHLPFGTRLLVSYEGRSVVVRINDRGPFVKGRSLDLSRGAARKLGCPGTCTVEIRIVK